MYSQGEQAGASEEEKDVILITKILELEYAKNQNKPVDYFHFVNDNTSFPKTLENVYNMSVIVQQGKAHLALDPVSGEAVIRPVTEADLKNHGGEGNNSIIISMSMSEWKNHKNKGVIQAYKEKGTL